MANEEQLNILQQGVSVWNAWRQEHPAININLREANLSGRDLKGANLRRANLSRADLSGADLSRADLSRAQLGRADLRQAHLNKADLSRARLPLANLRGADCSEATLRIVDFWRADLRHVVFTRALFYETLLCNTDLTGARGLDSCVHDGPSTIDHRTLTKSGGLSLPFLRGCGLPEALINALSSLLHDPSQLYSSFISYSHQDEPFAQRLHDALQGKGVRCWYAPEDIQGGKKIYEQIDAAIQVYDKLLLVLSDHSMQSEWVKTEIANARRREVTQKRQILFPIRLVDYEIIGNWTCFDADTGKDSAREIREYFIPDFSNWKDYDSFERAFTRLLRDLKADEAQPST